MNTETKTRNSRKSFATETLKNITNRLNYYNRMMKNKTNEDIEASPRLRRIRNKYNHAMKVRFILNRALSHRYECVKSKKPIPSLFENLRFE